jgi:hypothetical protein
MQTGRREGACVRSSEIACRRAGFVAEEQRLVRPRDLDQRRPVRGSPIPSGLRLSSRGTSRWRPLRSPSSA